MTDNLSNRNPRSETDWEVSEAKRIFKENPLALNDFWNKRYLETYSNVLESISEFGRHGVIGEYIIRLVKSGKILDVGCGTGILSELINTTKFEYEGIDISSEALEIANHLRNKKSVDFILSSFEKYTSKNKFNAIILNEIIYYLDYKQTILKIKKCLIDDGIIIVSIFDFEKGISILEMLKKDLNVFSETVIQTPKENLKWTVLACKLHHN
jgi:2-polyprenyl-3-methyl-5-hydroxy-6-metoxy-1,4-benzoquinol methylase